MNKKTQIRMNNIKKNARLITFNERGMSAKIEAEPIKGLSTLSIARGFGVSEEYVNAVKQAMERRK